jgi:glycosyltransferase involved in cell wall biosynthesis
MRFKIISTGWNCERWIEQTLQSVESQLAENWDICIVYDPSADRGADVIKQWCDARDDRWQYQINDSRQFAVRNQWEGIKRMNPEPDDIIVWLDLDGDRLAHPEVLSRLATYYDDDTLVTYGNYEPVPDVGRRLPVEPFPPDVVERRTYRAHTLMGGCCFNHLRTMKGKVFDQIPDYAMKWREGPLTGQWYEIGTDYVFMMAALELANGRYRCIRETMLLYNHANPLADNVAYTGAGVSCVLDCLQQEPLPPLQEIVVPPTPEFYLSKPVGRDEWFLPAEERREILREFGKVWGLDVLIETGTNQGLTPLALRDSFQHIYTIELSPDLHYAAAAMLAPYPNIHCVLGDSSERLPDILSEINQSSLVWLDGHYSGPGTAYGQVSTPIRDELRILMNDSHKHVILVDDARIFEGGPEHDMYDHYASYPSLTWVEEIAAVHGYLYCLEDDIIRLTPR